MPFSGKNDSSGRWIAELLQSSARPVAERRVGIEIERIGLWEDFTPFQYQAQEKNGAKDLLQELHARHGWPLIHNAKGDPLGMASEFGKVSLEPGSQVELSTDPFSDLVTLKGSVDQFEKLVASITDPWGLQWVGLGVTPLHQVSEIDLIPSTRYEIMTEYLGARARLGTSMMRRTSSVQINLDYSNEAEAIEMLRVSLLAAPIAYALFGNSPFVDGKESGYQSYRCEIWRETDPARTGLLPEAFQTGFNFQTYGNFLWHRPLMFAQNDKNQYVPAHGKSLDAISRNELSQVSIDENNQLNAIRELFTESRLKPGYVEIRSVDGQLPEFRYAAAAFWTGLLYSSEARRLALHLLSLEADRREELLVECSRHGLKAKLGQIEVSAIARDLCTAAEDSLRLRARGEEKLLEPAFELLSDKMNPAERLIKNYEGGWRRDIREAIRYSRQR